MDAPVRVVEYDRAWPARAGREIALLEALLGPWLAGAVEHVGSTAVPGLAAKPTIDLAAPVADLPLARAEAVPRLVDEADYVFPAAYNDELGGTRLWLCKPSRERRDFHLHLVTAGSDELRRRVAFRDALRADAGLRSEYETLKHTLAARHAGDREAYTDGKSAFVAHVERALGFGGG